VPRPETLSAYFALKVLHLSCVITSVTAFAARFALALRGSALLHRRWMRILPHVNDTLLLMAAIAMVVMSGQYPFVDAWLTAKVFGLIFYIVLASVALKAGHTQRVRFASGLAALLVFGYVATVALTKDARGPLVWLAL